MIWAVIVRAAGDAHWHVIGVAVGYHEHVGAGFTGRIWTVRCERSFFCEESVGTVERTVDFVGRHLMIAFAGFPGWITLFVLSVYPCMAGGVKDILRSENIHAKEKLRVFNGAIYMTFGGEIHNVVDSVVFEQPVEQSTVANITFNEHATFVVDIIFDGAQVSGIGE